MGEAREKLGEMLDGVVETRYAKNLNEAVNIVLKEAKPGDIVLFSPGCASFDEFENYEQRGDAFRRFVLEKAPEILGETLTKRVYH